MSATIEPSSTTATATTTEGTIGAQDLGPLIARIRSLLARVSSGEVVAPPAFEQRLFGGLVALEAVAADAPISIKALVDSLSDA